MYTSVYLYRESVCVYVWCVLARVCVHLHVQTSSSASSLFTCYTSSKASKRKSFFVFFLVKYVLYLVTCLCMPQLHEFLLSEPVSEDNQDTVTRMSVWNCLASNIGYWNGFMTRN